MFTDLIAILDVLARSETGATVGQIQKTVTWLQRGQVERMLKALITDKYVSVEKVPYRTNINKNVYSITETTVNSCRMIVNGYERRMKQQSMDDKRWLGITS